MATYLFLFRHDAQGRHFHVTWIYGSSGTSWTVDSEDADANPFLTDTGHVRIGQTSMDFLGPNRQVFARIHLPTSSEGFDEMDIATSGAISHMLAKHGFPSTGWRWILQERQ